MTRLRQLSLGLTLGVGHGQILAHSRQLARGFAGAALLAQQRKVIAQYRVNIAVSLHSVTLNPLCANSQ